MVLVRIVCGGAKMTFLDTGVVIKVVDSTLVNYKVQLSKGHFGLSPKKQFPERHPYSSRNPITLPTVGSHT
jgi:hypothetical protein